MDKPRRYYFISYAFHTIIISLFNGYLCRLANNGKGMDKE